MCHRIWKISLSVHKEHHLMDKCIMESQRKPVCKMAAPINKSSNLTHTHEISWWTILSSMDLDAKHHNRNSIVGLYNQRAYNTSTAYSFQKQLARHSNTKIMWHFQVVTIACNTRSTWLPVFSSSVLTLCWGHWDHSSWYQRKEDTLWSIVIHLCPSVNTQHTPV